MIMLTGKLPAVFQAIDLFVEIQAVIKKKAGHRVGLLR